jgi:glycosyltransferase involved in cell wall biosynthesis
VAKNKENILVITYWEYNDALIQTYTLPYLKLISEIINSDSKIFLTTLEKSNNAKSAANNKIFNISFKYRKFGILGLIMWIKILFKLLILIRKEKITTIHTWCTPAGAIGYILSLITKRKLIIDSFEPHAEAMVEGKTWKRNSIAFKILFYLERLQLKRATEVICANNGMIEYSKQTYKVQKKKYYVKPACVDLNLFSINDIKDPILINELNLKNKITCVYAGKFGGLYLEVETFYFFKAAANYWGDQFVILLLTSHSDEEIKKYLEIVKLSEKHIIKKFVPHNLVPKYMGLADFAICPMKPLPCRKYSTPIKNGEYWALGLPIVITQNISDDSDLISQNKIGSLIEELTPEAYLKCIKEIDLLLKEYNRKELYEKIRPIAEKHRNFSIAETVYKSIY